MGNAGDCNELPVSVPDLSLFRIERHHQFIVASDREGCQELNSRIIQPVLGREGISFCLPQIVAAGVKKGVKSRLLVVRVGPRAALPFARSELQGELGVDASRQIESVGMVFRGSQDQLVFCQVTGVEVQRSRFRPRPILSILLFPEVGEAFDFGQSFGIDQSGWRQERLAQIFTHRRLIVVGLIEGKRIAFQRQGAKGLLPSRSCPIKGFVMTTRDGDDQQHGSGPLDGAHDLIGLRKNGPLGARLSSKDALAWFVVVKQRHAANGHFEILQ